jgi:hypothetical protein
MKFARRTLWGAYCFNPRASRLLDRLVSLNEKPQCAQASAKSQSRRILGHSLVPGRPGRHYVWTAPA